MTVSTGRRIDRILWGMEFGIQVTGNYDHVLAMAHLAMERNLAAIALPDHYLMALDEEQAKETPANDAFIQFGGLARETSDIELVMLVSPITFRHPAVILKSAVTLHNMSDGRFKLGVGTGWMDREHEVFGFDYPEMAERFDRLDEALGYITAALDPDHPGFSGHHYTLEAFPLAPAPVTPLPIVVGGTGAHKTPRLAGTYAHEFNVYPGRDLADRIQRMKGAAVDAGRDPADILLTSSGQVMAAETEADFESLMAERAAEAGMTRDELEDHFEKRQTPRGTFEQVRATLDGFGTLGIRRFYFQAIFAPGDLDTLMRGLELA